MIVASDELDDYRPLAKEYGVRLLEGAKGLEAQRQVQYSLLQECPRVICADDDCFRFRGPRAFTRSGQALDLHQTNIAVFSQMAANQCHLAGLATSDNYVGDSGLHWSFFTVMRGSGETTMALLALKFQLGDP